MADITYEIREELGSLSERGGWSLDLNLISWNHRALTYDLRKWADDGRMGKGVSMTLNEVIALRDLLNSLELD